MIYADSSFLLRLLSHEAGSEKAVAVFRRLGRPALVFTPLHEIEVRNGLRMKAFVETRIKPSAKTTIQRELAEWTARLDRFLGRGTFASTEVDWEAVVPTALGLSGRHTLRLGCRAYDILHVAMGIELDCQQFVTCDARQGKLARSAGLKVVVSAAG